MSHSAAHSYNNTDNTNTDNIHLAEAILAKHRDISRLTGELTTIMCSPINKITPDEIPQKSRGTLLLYVRTDNDRAILLKNGKLHLTDNAQLPLYNDCPFNKK